jgi:hypothetical protein
MAECSGASKQINKRCRNEKLSFSSIHDYRCACVSGLIAGVIKGEFPLGVLAGFIAGGLLIVFVHYLRKQKNNQSF